MTFTYSSSLKLEIRIKIVGKKHVSPFFWGITLSFQLHPLVISNIGHGGSGAINDLDLALELEPQNVVALSSRGDAKRMLNDSWHRFFEMAETW